MAAKTTLENLKNIHEMQKEGTILEFLRDIRGLKSQLEEYSNKLASRKQKLKEEAALALLRNQKDEVVKEEEKPSVKPISENQKVEKVRVEPQSSYRKFDSQKTFIKIEILIKKIRIIKTNLLIKVQ